MCSSCWRPDETFYSFHRIIQSRSVEVVLAQCFPGCRKHRGKSDIHTSRRAFTKGFTFKIPPRRIDVTCPRLHGNSCQKSLFNCVPAESRLVSSTYDNYFDLNRIGGGLNNSWRCFANALNCERKSTCGNNFILPNLNRCASVIGLKFSFFVSPH